MSMIVRFCRGGAERKTGDYINRNVEQLAEVNTWSENGTLSMLIPCFVVLAYLLYSNTPNRVLL
jgi:hypothetical protein